MLRSIKFLAAITVLMIGISCLPIFSFTASAAGVQILSGSPGDVISYSGQSGPNSLVTMEVSASISVNTWTSGDNKRYEKSLNGVNIPGGSNSMSISTYPVDTLTVTGGPSWAGGLGYSMTGSVSNNRGSFSMSNVPGGKYNIVVSGISNGSSQSVSMSVKASQKVSADADGKFSVSLDTGGLPAAVYSVKQNGMEVALVYLGVTPPATPTPVPTPVITATPTATSSPTVSPTVVPSDKPTITPTAEPTAIPSPTPSIVLEKKPEQGQSNPISDFISWLVMMISGSDTQDGTTTENTWPTINTIFIILTLFAFGAIIVDIMMKRKK
ncbi:PT domain-containing protein [Methanooceanicella nereidis]|uniref:PT domain-containing protein n=1 Tax=Methanooceanicella nereidis TaxID=2052831 RepID=UPI001E499DF9|nr:PT domain-containing protein [Methanocella sp. CWC-04]